MHEYYCRKCRLLFENSLSQTRCPTYKCQSRQIKEINVPHKGVTYSNLEWCFEDEGEKNRRRMDKQGLPIRVAQQIYEEELFRMSDNDNTQPGAMDDDAVKRAKENKRKKEKTLQEIFDDNSTGRYSSNDD